MNNAVDPKNVVGSIIKASRLLDLFSVERREITLGEFASETGYNKTTTYRLLQTLVAVGWMVRSTSGGYQLGVRMLVLGAVARADIDLRNEALPFMRRLADELGDTTFLMIPSQYGALTVETVVGKNPLQVHGLVAGSTLPYNAAAGPVVLAAFSPEIESAVLRAEKKQFTAKTVTTAPGLRAKFAEVRKLGYSFSAEDYIESVSAVAAPVLDAHGEAIAALSVGGPTLRFTDELREQTINLVCKSAAELSARLDY